MIAGSDIANGSPARSRTRCVAVKPGSKRARVGSRECCEGAVQGVIAILNHIVS